MIPTRLLADWRPFVPWPDEDQVEQGLVLTRVLITLFSDPLLGSLLALANSISSLLDGRTPEPGIAQFAGHAVESVWVWSHRSRRP